MKTLKITAVVVAVTGLAVLVPSVSERLDTRVSAQDRSRELTIMGRGGELGVRISDAATGGVEIEEVEPAGAADKAGLKRGDVIVEFDGEHVRGGRQFARLVRETPSGRSVKATIVRDGTRRDIQVTPSEGSGTTLLDGGRFFDRDALHGPGGRIPELERSLRDLPFNFNFDFDVRGMMSGGRLGVTVDPLTNQLAAYFGAKDGVLVTSVADGSAASRAGLKAGDVITSIDGDPVTSPSDLTRALRRGDRTAGATENDVTIGIVRDRKETTLKATIEPRRRSSRSARPA
jgi:serine protease Do